MSQQFGCLLLSGQQVEGLVHGTIQHQGEQIDDQDIPRPRWEPADRPEINRGYAAKVDVVAASQQVNRCGDEDDIEVQGDKGGHHAATRRLDALHQDQVKDGEERQTVHEEEA